MLEKGGKRLFISKASFFITPRLIFYAPRTEKKILRKKETSMYGFKTKNNTKFTIDSVNKTISGGILGDKEHKYIKATILIGFPAEVTLADGRILTTSTVEQYLHF